jgi:hypothetical protein
MSNVQSLVTNAQLQNMIGQTVTIRFPDESEKTGKVGAYDAGKQLVRIDWHGKTHFWIPTTAVPGMSIRHAIENI